MITSGAAQPAVSRDELRAYAAELGIDEYHIWETSAKTGANVNDLFEAVALEFKGPEAVDPQTVSPEVPKPDSNGSAAANSTCGC